MPLHIIVIGPSGVNNTAFIHRIIQDNEAGTFSFIIDGVDWTLMNYIIPHQSNWIVSALDINNIPAYLRQGSVILNVPHLRQ